MSALKYWLWLSMAPGLSPRTCHALLDYYGSPEAMYFAPFGEMKRLAGNHAEGLDALEKRDLDSALRIIDACNDQNITILTAQDAGYPDRLRSINLPPKVIYVKGKLPAVDDEPVIAIVGTRRASYYGLKMARRFGYEISKCGGVVVSGLTAGIDANAAEGTLSAGGKVIGVLGVPHEQARGHLCLDVLHSGGALVSEYPPGTPVYSSYFRARNRISAGLSLGVVVVEAPERSGARLFANEAADQGKELFVVPGDAGEDRCAGSNAILKEGAKPVTEGWDVMCEYASLYPERVHRSTERFRPENFITPTNVKRNPPPETEKVSKKVIDNENAKGYIDLKKRLEGLSEIQLKLISVIDRPSVQVDEIIEKSGYTAAKVLSELTMLQIEGLVKQEPGKRFTLIIK